MANNQQLLLGEGAGGAPAVYIEDVFSTYLYTGNGTTQTITTGIDLSTKGGMIWFKERASQGFSHALIDTARGNSSPTEALSLASDNTNSQSSVAAVPTSSGFSLSGPGSAGPVNYNGSTYASWTFREQPKFFDIVTYTGDGVGGRQIPHALGGTIGAVIIKCTSLAVDWVMWHRSQSLKFGVLNTTAEFTTTDAPFRFGNNSIAIDPTDSVITVGGSNKVNSSGATYVAYIFAHDAGGFGASGTDNVISCGSFTTDGSGVATVSLGYEPQWILVKFNSNDSWKIFDTMRGMSQTGWNELNPNTSGAEVARTNQSDLNIRPSATGFTITWSPQASNTAIYIAIRRGPMKVPTVGTSVYNNLANRVGTSATATISGVGFPVDLMIPFNETSGSSKPFVDRLRGETKYLLPPYTNAEQTNTDVVTSFASNDGVIVGADATLQVINRYYDPSRRYAASFFRRAPSFFDEVCYTGTGVNPTNFNHNLGAIPELMIVKKRSGADRWECYSAALGSTKRIDLNTDGAATTVSIWGGTPTATQFSLTDNSNVNQSGQTNVAYLFATCAGVSKVGSYTGTGALQTVACGFTSGARFILIKRTDSTGDWYMYDSARGISSGNDPYLLLNTTDASVLGTNYVDTDTTGFKVTAAAPAAINANGGTFIFLAIA